MTSVDIVIPCFKYAHYLEKCVRSILSQRGVEVRVLIVDDASPDNTPEIAAQLVGADSRVSYSRNAQNLGLIGSANSGIIQWAHADYLLLISADDFLLPGALARAAYVLNAHPDVHMVYGMAMIVTDDDRAVDSDDRLAPTYQIIAGRDYVKQSCKTGVPAPSPSVLVRTSVQHALGGYVSRFPHTSDMEMWLRFAARGPIGVIKQAQAGYRWHGANMTLAYTGRVVMDRRMRIQTCEYVRDQLKSDNLEGFDGWIAEMKVAYAREALYLAGRALEASDTETYDACLAFAAEYAPELVHRAAWRLGLRRLMGPATGRAVRKVMNALRNHPDEANWFQHNRELGWWPVSGDASAAGGVTQ